MNQQIKSLLMMAPMLFSGLISQAAPAPDPADKGPYAESKIFEVKGPGGWDYLTVDSEHHLLYVPRSTHTLVLDAANGKTMADIPGQQRNHGVALVPDAGRGFITDGQEGTVDIFDLKTNTMLGKVKAAEDADGIIYDPSTRKVLVSCGDADVLVVISPNIDPKDGKVDAAIPLGGKPEFLAADGKGKVFVNLEDKDQVAVVDIKALKVVNKWSVTPGGAPVGMSMDTAKSRLFVGCRKPQKLVVMSAEDGKVLANLPIGSGVDATNFDNGYVFASCSDGTLTVAHETADKGFGVVQTLTTRKGARTMGIDTKTHEIFLPTAEFGPPANPQGRPVAKPDSFQIVVVGPSHQ